MFLQGLFGTRFHRIGGSVFHGNTLLWLNSEDCGARTSKESAYRAIGMAVSRKLDSLSSIKNPSLERVCHMFY